MQVEFFSKMVRVVVTTGLVIYILLVTRQYLHLLVHFGHQLGAEVPYILLLFLLEFFLFFLLNLLLILCFPLLLDSCLRSLVNIGFIG